MNETTRKVCKGVGVENPLFNSGILVMTGGVHERILEAKGFAEFVFKSLARHLAGDWGDLDPEDRKENERSLKEGLRLFSSYEEGDVKIWVITEADRSATTILFPDEY